MPLSTTPAHDTPDSDEEEARLRMIWNEQRKLEATFINNLGVATVAAGAITPLLANLYGVSDAPPLSWLTNGWLIPIVMVAGFGLNALAVHWLKGLE